MISPVRRTDGGLGPQASSALRAEGEERGKEEGRRGPTSRDSKSLARFVRPPGRKDTGPGTRREQPRRGGLGGMPYRTVVNTLSFREFPRSTRFQCHEGRSLSHAALSLVHPRLPTIHAARWSMHPALGPINGPLSCIPALILWGGGRDAPRCAARRSRLTSGSHSFSEYSNPTKEHAGNPDVHRDRGNR